jgi:DNA-binding beta-propeller fold protein YncE
MSTAKPDRFSDVFHVAVIKDKFAGVRIQGMKIPFTFCVFASCIGLSILCPAVSAGDGSVYRVSRSLKIGGEGSWDYLAVDEANRHLFVSHATQVEVIDLESGKLIKAIKDTPGVHGIAIASKPGRGFISCGRANSVLVFDLKTLAEISRVPAGEGPDAIMFDSASNRVFAMNGHGASATVIDAEKASVVGTIPLGGKPEFTVADGKGAAFVNLEDKDSVSRYDTAKMEVTATWPLAPCKGPGSMALDKKSNRLFIGCGNDLMVVVDPATGKVVAQAPVGHGVDAAVFESHAGLIFESSGDGKVTILHEDSPDKYTVVATVATPKGAKTMTRDPKTHNMYLSVADFGPMPAATKETPKPKAPVIAGTFRVIELVPTVPIP